MGRLAACIVFMMKSYAAWILVLVACKPHEEPKPAPTASVVSQAATCKDEAAALRMFADNLSREGVVQAEVFPVPGYGYEDRPLPTIPLVALDQPPTAVPLSVLVSMHRGQVKFGDSVAPIHDEAKTKSLLEAASSSGLSAGAGDTSNNVSSWFQAVNLFIGADELWVDVAALLRLSRAADFTVARFVFAAKSSTRAPDDSPLGQKMRSLASARGEAPMKRDAALQVEFARAIQACPALAAPFEPRGTTSKETDRQRSRFHQDAAWAFESCGCNVPRRDIETFMWLSYGRHWGPALTSVTLDLGTTWAADTGKPASLMPIIAKGDLPFKEAVSAISSGGSQKGAVLLVAE